MAIGKSNGGYATINRSANYFGGAMQNAQDNAFRFRQERKVKEDEAKAEKQAELEKIKPYDIKNIATLNGNLEKLKSKFALNQQQSGLEAQEIIRTTKDPKEKELALAKYNNVKNNFDLVNSFSTNVNTMLADLTKNQANYDEKSYNEAMAKLLMTSKGYGDLNLEPDGQLMFSETDQDGNVVSDKKTFVGFLGGIQDSLLSKSTFDADLKADIDGIGYLTKEDGTGKTITETVNVTPESLLASKTNFINKQLGNDSNIRIYARNNNIPEYDIDALKASIGEVYDSRLKETDKKTFNAHLVASEQRELENKQDEAQIKIDNALKEKQLALQKAKENRIAKAEGKKINKRANGTLKPTFDDVYTTGVEVIRNETFDGEGNTIPKQVKIGARVISIDGMETYGANKLVKSKLTKTFVNPDGSIVMVGNTYDEKGGLKEKNVVWDKNEDQLEFINSVTKDYDNNGNPVNFETINNFKKHVIDKTGIKVKPKTTATKSEAEKLGI